MMNNDHKFDINSFICPDVSHAPVYVWVWNDICTKEIIDSQLSEMQDLGIRAFYILPEPKNFRPDNMPTNLIPDYLSSGYFSLCTYAIKKGTELGMRCWIYDEGGWPSGSACGRVVRDNPDHAQQILKAYERIFSSGEEYKKSNPDILAAFVQDKEMITEGYVFTEDSTVTEYLTEKETSSDYPDLLNKNATLHFISTTHQKYASSLKDMLGKTVTAVFTDEPKVSRNTFNEELKKQYETTYGESVLPYLPLIAQRTEVTEDNVHFLQRWYDLCSRMFCDNYLLPCKKWANEHGIAFTGHLDKDHDPLGCIRGGGNFNLMRALRCFDIPGIDVIWRQIYPENKVKEKNELNAYNGFFPRYASSAAVQNGTKLAMSEIFGVAGPGLTYDTMRYTVGYQAVRGINIFNPFNFPLGRKDAYLAQELPVFTQNQIFYRHLNQFNRYTERLSYIVSSGERVCKTALYYPVCDFQGGLNADRIAAKFDSLGRMLEDMNVDFDIVDDDVIQSAQVTDNGYLCIGCASYRTVIIPESAFIPQSTLHALNRFRVCGGQVLSDPAGLPPVIETEGTGLRAMHRKTENADIFCLFRESGESSEYLIHLPSPCGYLLDLSTGNLQHFRVQNEALQLSLAIGETAVILLTDEELDSEDKINFRIGYKIPENFTFRRKAELIFNKNGFDSIKYDEKSVSVALGDWSGITGNKYSGNCIYETSFTLPDRFVTKKGEIDLGEVRYIAQVYLNGQLLGTALTPPYRLTIPGNLLCEDNNLKVIVTNTPANLYVHTDYFKKWDIKELSPYFEGELKLAEDVASGGLYGPVTLYLQDDQNY